MALPDHQAPLFEGTEEEIAAAKKIQAMHRGRAARADVEKLKADKHAAKAEAAAAAKSLTLAEETALLAAEAEREAAKRAKEEAEASAIIMPDGTAVPSAKGPVQVQRGRKKSGAGQSTKKLLKQLRKIAEVAHNEGLL